MGRSKQYTLYVQWKGDAPVVRYESHMGKLDTVQVMHETGLKRYGQMTPSTCVDLHLVAANIPGMPNLYHRVQWSRLQQCYICSCNNGPNCEHWKPICKAA